MKRRFRALTVSLELLTDSGEPFIGEPEPGVERVGTRTGQNAD